MELITVPVDVWSDVACPWCYVGKARLDAAVRKVEARPRGNLAVKVDVEWHAYMIDPRTAAEGEDYLAYNQRRWGSDSWTHSLRRSGAASGLGFKDWRWWPNTLHAHRLVHKAKTMGKGSEAKQMLLELTYERGANVSSIDVLCSAAESLGIPGADTYLRSGEGRAEVLEEDRVGKREKRIGGVPYFIVDSRWTLSGAQVRIPCQPAGSADALEIQTAGRAPLLLALRHGCHFQVGRTYRSLPTETSALERALEEAISRRKLSS